MSDCARNASFRLASLTIAFLLVDGCCKESPSDPPQSSASEIWRSAIDRYPALFACIVPSELREHVMKDLPLLDHRAIVDPSIDAMIEPHVEATAPPNPEAVADPKPEVDAEPELESAAVSTPEATDEPSYRTIVSISQILLSDGCAVSVLAGPRGEIYVVAQGGLDGSTRIELGPFAPDASDF